MARVLTRLSHFILCLIGDLIFVQVVLSQRVRHYLMWNQIRWGQFARLVLGVGQARLSTLLGSPRPWQTLSLRLRFANCIIQCCGSGGGGAEIIWHL